MNKYDKEMLEAQIRSAPKRVGYTCTTAWLLATLLLVRFFVLTPAPLNKSVIFVTLILFNFVFNGMSILVRSKIGYLLLAFFSSVSLLRASEETLELVDLVVTGQWRDNSHAVALGLSGVLVIAAITLLFRNLYSKEVRSYVWSSPPLNETSPVIVEN